MILNELQYMNFIHVHHKKKIIKKMNPEKVYLQILCHETIFFLKKSFLSCY